jgi:hypothetical protein
LTCATAITDSGASAAAIACATPGYILPALLGSSTKLLPRFDRVVGARAVKFLRRALVSIRDAFAVFGVVLPIALTLLVDLSPLL